MLAKHASSGETPLYSVAMIGALYHCEVLQALDIIIFSSLDFMKRRKMMKNHKAKTRSKGIQASDGDMASPFARGIFSLSRENEIKHLSTRLAPYKTGGL